MEIILAYFPFPLLGRFCFKGLMDKIVFGLFILSKSNCNRWLIISFKNSWLLLLHFLYIGQRGEVLPFIFAALLTWTCFQNGWFWPALFQVFLLLLLSCLQLVFVFVRTFLLFSDFLYAKDLGVPITIIVAFFCVG